LPKGSSHGFALGRLDGDGMVNLHRPFFMSRVEVRVGDLLDPCLIGDLDRPGVCFQQSVFERKAGLGPGQQIVAADKGRELR
jgi:hypothetical protein